ncbi:extracellular solute-binding protein [Aestuariirhabdus sp. Z084]|uniref:extracellular solute-binding protein n=1 Tax=Aestuariirhabdus haliotis TaxID=2918751 RepID=UPI00201B431C|nr:extracellular solute-binding protein [Aestuariirhabdus haliotis]MCL6416626.1 extracellular solute-binding protein [Aestuariirhabdus haliotis]MCL6420661.1 extracellular solute-binding protein [Aestuariirhabdus haliotis]
MLTNARKLLLTFAATAVVTVNSSLALAADDELVVYSARKEHLIKPLFDAYTAKTGVEVKYVTDKAGPLLARLEAEGANTPADLLITVDAGNLWQAANKGVLQAVESSVLEKNIPAHLRATNNEWVGLSVRARTIVYATDRVKPEELSSYEALAESQWKGRLCLRTSKKVYNQSLVATMIERLGEEQAEQVVKGWVNNLATPVFSNDTKAMQAVAAGQCDATIVNTYYFGRLQKKDPNINLKLFFANQQSSGVHVNVSGAGVTKHAKNAAGAVKFLEWMSSPEAQSIVADGNMEYPANPAVKPAALVAAWGEFKQDQLNVESAGSRQADAIKLMDRAGYR